MLLLRGTAIFKILLHFLFLFLVSVLRLRHFPMSPSIIIN